MTALDLFKLDSDTELKLLSDEQRLKKSEAKDADLFKSPQSPAYLTELDLTGYVVYKINACKHIP